MYWSEQTEEEVFSVPDDVVDLAFELRCKTLPVDHAHALSMALQALLPWLRDEPLAGLHTVHGAESGNGWERPEGAGETVYLSRRTKLILRLPRHRLEQARALSGQTLCIEGHSMALGNATSRLLSTSTTLYARYVHLPEAGEDEPEFMAAAVALLRERGLGFKKILCGKVHEIRIPEGGLLTRSLMIAGLSVEDAVRLQQVGLGSARTLGCGLFIPHKSV